MYWEQVLKEVLNKDAPNQTFLFTNLAECKCQKNKKNLLNAYLPETIKKIRILKTYPLGDKFRDIHLSQREAECMALILKGKTLSTVAEELKLSIRTVEFYLKNMKTKLNCKSKFALIEQIQQSDFSKNIEYSLHELHN